jgi:hypothetical protein
VEERGGVSAVFEFCVCFSLAIETFVSLREFGTSVMFGGSVSRRERGIMWKEVSRTDPFLIRCTFKPLFFDGS